MLRLVLGACFLLAVGFSVGSARADDKPKKKPDVEIIPAPKAIPTPTFSIERFYQRSDTRDVWQHYGVNSFGRFVPRVIRIPDGYYYSRDLQPYPWAGARPRAFLP